MTSTLNHIAFDLGLETTGVAFRCGSEHHRAPNALRSSPMTQAKRHARFVWWRDTFRATLLLHGDGPVYVEAPFMSHAHPSGAVPLIMLHGILRAVAIDLGRDVYEVENQTLKQWATGKGNASKDEMMAAARAYGWTGDDHNEADAYLLWSMVAEGAA